MSVSLLKDIHDCRSLPLYRGSVEGLCLLFPVLFHHFAFQIFRKENFLLIGTLTKP